MEKPNFQRTTIARINAAAPQLKFVAFYHADEDRIKACMNGYKHRSFVYILSVDHEDSEVYLYAGKSKSQYSRFISHLAKFAFDHIYLFECLPEQLTESEAAVIQELCPILNRHHNPQAEHNRQFLGINYDAIQDAETIHRYLKLRDRYTPTVLYGFSLPPSVYSVLEQNAMEKGCSGSELLQRILEQTFGVDIADHLNNADDPVPQTNLITSKAYGRAHGKSREQVKQYLIQGNRVLGATKIGRDWVLTSDAKFPSDHRKKLQR